MNQNSERLQKERDRKRRDKVRLDADALRFVLSDPRGRRFWSNLIYGHLNLERACTDVSAQSHRFEGRRLAAVELIGVALAVDPKGYFAAQREKATIEEHEFTLGEALRELEERTDA